MKLTNNILITIILGAFLFSCGTPKTFTQYSDSILKLDRTEFVRMDTINSHFLFNYARQMEILKDSLLIIFDDGVDGNCFHIFRQNGELLKSFGRLGRGPGEIIGSTGFSLSENGDKLYSYDDMRKVMIEYNLELLLVSDSLVYNEKPVINSIRENIKDAGKRYTTVYHAPYYDDNSFLVFGNDDNLRIGIYENEIIKNLYSEYPLLVKTNNIEEIWSVFGNSVKYKVSPDGSKIVITTYIGAVMELFDIKSKEVRHRQLVPLYKPIYNIAQGAIPTWVTSSEETIIGFTEVYVTDNYIYASLMGENNKEGHFIYVFDWDGNVVSKYDVMYDVLAIAVDENSRNIFSVINKGDNGISLVKCQY